MKAKPTTWTFKINWMKWKFRWITKLHSILICSKFVVFVVFVGLNHSQTALPKIGQWTWDIQYLDAQMVFFGNQSQDKNILFIQSQTLYLENQLSFMVYYVSLSGRAVPCWFCVRTFSMNAQWFCALFWFKWCHQFF